MVRMKALPAGRCPLAPPKQSVKGWIQGVSCYDPSPDEPRRDHDRSDGGVLDARCDGLLPTIPPNCKRENCTQARHYPNAVELGRARKSGKDRREYAPSFRAH